MVSSANTSNFSLPVLKLLLLVLAALFLLLQYRLWFSGDNIIETRKLEHKLESQRVDNQQQVELNNQLRAEVDALKTSLSEVEARARKELGMVKQGETYFMLLESPPDSAGSNSAGE